MLRKLPTTFALLLLWLFGSALAQTDEPNPTSSPCPTLLARDVLAPTDSHRVSLVFPLLSNVDPATLGDGDLILYGANGTEERAHFEGFSREHLPAQPNESFTDLRMPEPRLIASYTFNGPGGNWDVENNGLYRVRLAEEAISNRDDRSFTSKFLGGFRCAIEKVAPQAIQPTNTRMTFHRTLVGGEVQHLADVTLTFNTPHVRLDWGSLVNDGTSFTTNTTVHRIPIPIVPVEIVTADEVASNTRPPCWNSPPSSTHFHPHLSSRSTRTRHL